MSKNRPNVATPERVAPEARADETPKRKPTRAEARAAAEAKRAEAEARAEAKRASTRERVRRHRERKREAEARAAARAEAIARGEPPPLPEPHPDGLLAMEREALVLERRSLVAGLIDAGASSSQIVAAFAEQYPHLRRDTVRKVATKYTDEARKARQEEYRSARSTYKAEQVARLRNDLLRMRAMDRKPWSSIAKHEELLARITGTLEPIGVAVSGSVAVHESLIAVVSKLDPHDVEELVAEQVALEAAAAQAGFVPSARRPMLEANAMDDRSSIRTEGVVVEPEPNPDPDAN